MNLPKSLRKPREAALINSYDKTPKMITYLNNNAKEKSKGNSEVEGQNNVSNKSDNDAKLTRKEKIIAKAEELIKSKINNTLKLNKNEMLNFDKKITHISDNQEHILFQNNRLRTLGNQEKNKAHKLETNESITDNDKTTIEMIKYTKKQFTEIKANGNPKLKDLFIISNESEKEQIDKKDLKLEEIKEDISGEMKNSQIKKVSYMQIAPTQALNNQEIKIEHPVSPNDKDKQAIIRVENAHKTYLMGLEGVAALRGVSLEIYEGEFVCIYGNSGGGKTTLLNIIGTIDKPSKGNIYINGTKINKNTSNSDLAALRLSKLAFVFQTFNLIPSLTAIENVELPLHLKGKLSNEKIREFSLKLLKDFKLESRIHHYPNQLSGGEQQRVTIARAIATNPKILLLDEPTGDLDSKNSDLVMNILIDLNMKRERKITMLMVTHDLSLKNYGTKIIKMVDGKIGNISFTSQEDRKQAIEELKARIFHLENEYINIQTGILKTKMNAVQEKDQLEKAKEIFPAFTFNKPIVSGNTKLRSPDAYAALCITDNKN